MGTGMVQDTRSFAFRLTDYLQEIDYREASTPQELDQIFRLRYDAYRREDAIEPDSSKRFRDWYDELDNCWNFGIYMHSSLVSAIRFHVISKSSRKGPALDVFPDIVGPMIEKGMTVVDPTRLVVSEEASRQYRELPYVTVRIACMASEYFGAKYCLATVRVEHMAFYKRIFGFKTISEPRPYPTLKKPICLMTGDMGEIRDRVAVRYPLFMSSFTERRMLFDRPDLRRLEDAAPLAPSSHRLAS